LKEKGLQYNLQQQGAMFWAFRAKSRDKKCLLSTLQIIPIFLLKIMPFINSAKI
jgi:hypothetical protein